MSEVISLDEYILAKKQEAQDATIDVQMLDLGEALDERLSVLDEASIVFPLGFVFGENA